MYSVPDNVIYINTCSEALKCIVSILFFTKKDCEFRVWPHIYNIYFILNCGISHLWKTQQPFWVFTWSSVEIPGFQLYPHSGTLSIHCGQTRKYLSCFLCFDVRYHPHLRSVYGFTWYLGEISPVKILWRSCLQTHRSKSNSWWHLFIYSCDGVCMYELNCRGQKEKILNQQMLPSVCAMAHTYFLFTFCYIRPFINLHYISSFSTSNILWAARTDLNVSQNLIQVAGFTYILRDLYWHRCKVDIKLILFVVITNLIA